MSHALLQQVLAAAPHHVSPFLVLGDPDPRSSVALARAAVAAGASMLELGFPFGDPCADGPAIQAANLRALQSGTSTQRAFTLLGEIRAACPRTPLNLLVYGNLVHRRGLLSFCTDAVMAGASSLLVPDMPLEEDDVLRQACARAGLGHCQLVGPRTPPARLRALDAACDAFLYLVAQQGVTGVRSGGSDATRLLQATVPQVRNPVCLGFGLSRREQITAAFAAGARIAVVGSHLANIIAHHADDPAAALHAAVAELLGAQQDGAQQRATGAASDPITTTPTSDDTTTSKEPKSC